MVIPTSTGWHHLSAKPEATVETVIPTPLLPSYEADPFMSPDSEVPQKLQPPDTPACHSETFVFPTPEVPQRYLPPTLLPILARIHSPYHTTDHTYHARLTCVLTHTFGPSLCGRIIYNTPSSLSLAPHMYHLGVCGYNPLPPTCLHRLR